MSSSSSSLPGVQRAALPLPAGLAGGAVRALFSGFGLARLTLWAALAALVVLPLAAILVLAWQGGGWHALLQPDVVQATVNSLVSAGVSAFGAVAIGTLFALLLERTNLPFRPLLRILSLSPMLVPPFVGAIAWLSLLGPASQLNLMWQRLFGGPLWNLYGGDGVIFLLTLHSYPVAQLIVTAALRRVPADLEQAARISGAGPVRTMWEVTTPLLRPAMLSAFTLLAVSNLADFGIPSIIGLPEQYVTLSTLVYRYLQSGTVADPLAVVAAIGFVLLVLALLGVVVDVARARSRVELDAASGVSPLELGRFRVPAGIVTLLVVAALTVLPLVTLGMQALLPAPGVPFSFTNVTFANFTRAVTASTTLSGLGNSLLLATLAAVICGVLGLGVATFVTRTGARDGKAMLALSLLPQAIPGLVIAVAWLLLAPHIGLYNTPWIILCAYCTSFLALVVQAVHAPLAGTPAAVEEAARIAGATRLRALWDVSCRMAIPAAVSGAVLVALTAVRELTLSVLLLSPGSATLGVAIFNLQQAGDYNAASSLSFLVAVAGLAGSGLTTRNNR